MNELTPTGEMYQTWSLLRRVSHLVLRVRDNELSRYGLTSAESAVLLSIRANDGKATPADISRRLLREPNSISAQVSRMAKKGLVKKTKDAHRKSVVRLSLTSKGRSACEKAANLESVRELLAVLSAKERARLRLSLDKLRQKGIEQLIRSKSSLLTAQQ